MPNNILSSLVSKSAALFVNEITNSPCWLGLSVKDVEINASALVTRNPLSTEQLSESSVYISLLALDIQSAKIIAPSRMRVTALVSDISNIDSILANFANTFLTMQVTSKGIISDSMAIVGVEIEQTPEMLSASRVVIEFYQTQPDPPLNLYNPAQSGDESVSGLRIQAPPNASQSLTSLAAKIGKTFGI
jgi:hypothetical protein